MGAAIPFIGPAIGAIGSIFGNKKSPQTQTQTTHQTSVPYYTPEQAGMNAMLGRVLRRMGKQPQIDERLRLQGRNQINDSFDQMNSRLDSTMVARGFGESGKHNLNTMGLEIERNKGFGSLESDLYNQAIQRQMQALQLATAFAQPHGSTTDSTSTGTGGGNTWGQAIGASIPGISDDIGTSLWLRKILGQGTSAGFGSAAGLGGVPDPYANPYGEGGN